MGVTFSLSTYAVNRKSLLVKSNLLYASTFTRCNSKLKTLGSSSRLSYEVMNKTNQTNRSSNVQDHALSKVVSRLAVRSECQLDLT